MLKHALVAALALSWPVALDFWVEPVLAVGERAGHTLGALYAPAPRTEAPALPPPSAEEAVVPLGESEVRELAADPNAEAVAEGKSSKSGKAKTKAKKRAEPNAAGALPTPKHGIRVNRANVLRLARARAVPSGQFVAAGEGRPAGIRLSGVSGLGIGVRDGDVLTHVSGVPVTDKGQVVNLVLQARARRAAQVTGRFYRGAEPWLLLVEMPYPEPKNPPAGADQP